MGKSGQGAEDGARGAEVAGPGGAYQKNLWRVRRHFFERGAHSFGFCAGEKLNSLFIIAYCADAAP